MSTARLELERLARQDEQARAQRERNQLLIAEKEQARFDQEKAVEIARGEFDGLQAQVHAIGEEYSVLRADPSLEPGRTAPAPRKPPPPA